MQAAGAVIAGHPMGDVAGDLDHGHSGHEHVYGQPHLDPPALGQGRRRLVGLPGQAALPRQRRDGRPAGGDRNGGAREPHHPAAPPGAGLLGRNGDGHVGDAVDDRGNELGAGGSGVAQIGIDEEQQTGRAVHVVAHSHHAGPGLQGGGLAAADGVPNRHRTGCSSMVLGAIGRAVIDDDDEIDAGNGPAGPHGGGDAIRLILGGNDDSHSLLRALVGLRLMRWRRTHRASVATGRRKSLFRSVHACRSILNRSTWSTGASGPQRVRRARLTAGPPRRPKRFQAAL